MRKPLLCPAPAPLSPKRFLLRSKRKNILKRNGTRKTLSRQQKIMPLKLKRFGVIKSAIIAKKCYFANNCLQFPKTSAGFDNFHTSNR